MKNLRPDVKCSHPRKDCTACREDFCIALEDTTFKNGKDCPFYMDKETSRQRQIECMARLATITGMNKRGFKSKIKSLLY